MIKIKALAARPRSCPDACFSHHEAFQQPLESCSDARIDPGSYASVLVLMFRMGVQVGVRVDHVAMLMAMGVDEIGAQEQFAVGEDF